MRKYKVYEALAIAIASRANCIARDNREWIAKHQATIDNIAREYLPSGSGIDNGTRVWTNDSTDEKLVLFCSFHHMDEMGGYDGWTDHKVIVTPSFHGGFDVNVKGIDRDGIKQYLSEVFYEALAKEVQS